MGIWMLWSRISSLLRRSRPETVDTTANRSDSREHQHQFPASQSLLLLHEAKQDYVLTYNCPIPVAEAQHEVIVHIQAIGLNPIDWKGPAFNFGIPELPYISGREFVGEVVQLPRGPSRLRRGDKVLVPSTDYRDRRKAAFQQYAVASDFNVIRLPPTVSVEAASTFGVAFVAASLALGICLGLDFSSISNGPDLSRAIRKLKEDELPSDVRSECLNGISEDDRAKAGDWIAIWGGSSSTAIIITQLAQLAGLKVISIVDQAKHGHRYSVSIDSTNPCIPDVVVDSHNPERAASIIREVTKGELRFGIDTRGKETASLLLQCLSGALEAEEQGSSSPDSEASTLTPTKRSHLVGLAGLPRLEPDTESLVKFHAVPIKVFHEVPTIGEALVLWLESLFERGSLKPPQAVGVEDGLENVNRGLEKMRKQGGRVVVRI